jgi:hypothetical protein
MGGIYARHSLDCNLYKIKKGVCVHTKQGFQNQGNPLAVGSR